MLLNVVFTPLLNKHLLNILGTGLGSKKVDVTEAQPYFSGVSSHLGGLMTPPSVPHLPYFLNPVWRGHWPTVSVALWLKRDKFKRTIESCEGKGTAQPLLRTPQPFALTAFIAFLGTSHWGWSSLTMHRFTLGGYLLQKAEEVANYIKKEGYL